MNIEMWGEVETLLVNNEAEGIHDICEKYAQHVPLNRDEREYLERNTKKKHRKKNMLMTRFIDRICATYGHSDTYAYTSAGNAISNLITQQNMIREACAVTVANTSPEWCYGNVPEIIGIGTGNTAVTPTDKGLDTPFALGVNPYRNTWNTKEEGTNPGTRDNILLRCGCVFDGTTAPPTPIQEVGLFTNKWYMSDREWAAGAIINFRNWGGGNLNYAWEILNISYVIFGGYPACGLCMMTRDDGGSPDMTYAWNRGTQIITYNGAPAQTPTPPPNTTRALICFSPHVQHVADAGEGSNLNWSINDPPGAADFPQLYARVVLPAFNKLANEDLIVVWMIYFQVTGGAP
jgi:hypothetical protein